MAAELLVDVAPHERSLVAVRNVRERRAGIRPECDPPHARAAAGERQPERAADGPRGDRAADRPLPSGGQQRVGVKKEEDVC